MVLKRLIEIKFRFLKTLTNLGIESTDFENIPRKKVFEESQAYGLLRRARSLCGLRIGELDCLKLTWKLVIVEH